MFVPDKSLQPSLMFAGKAGAYASEAPFYFSLIFPSKARDHPSGGLAWPKNITVGLKYSVAAL